MKVTEAGWPGPTRCCNQFVSIFRIKVVCPARSVPVSLRQTGIWPAQGNWAKMYWRFRPAWFGLCPFGGHDCGYLPASQLNRMCPSVWQDIDRSQRL